MQHVLQAGLSAGLSATSGIHKKDVPKVDPSFDGLKTLLPSDFVPTKETRLTLKGKKDNIQVPLFSWGAWSWGDTATWHWDDAKERPALKQAWQLAADNGLTFIDTAQAYGTGESERICGELIRGMDRSKVFLQTKWYVVPNKISNFSSDAPLKYLQDSLKNMGTDYVDCYLVHGHIHVQSIKKVAASLAEIVDKGMAKTVGVANYSKEDMIQMADALREYDIPLATNQCEFNILRRYPETSGLLEECKQRGIIFQSYSSLAQGRLTGKYGPGNEPPETYRFSQIPMENVEPTVEVLRDIANKRGVSISGVALNYNMVKGILPVIGIRSPAQYEQNTQAFGWRLDDEEVKRIDSVSFEGKTTVLWQQN